MSKRLLFKFLQDLKNAGKMHSNKIIVKNNKMTFYLINLLYNEGYLAGFFFKRINLIIVFLKYCNGKFLLDNLKIYKKPLKCYYFSYKKLCQFYYGVFHLDYFLLLSTSYGLLSLHELILNNYKIGGEFLFSINL